MKLSILICSLNSRVEKRKELVALLLSSIGQNYCEETHDKDYLIQKYIGEQAEVIICTDDKQMSVGAKRNMLIKHAAGAYISFIDDDDMVMPEYVARLLGKMGSSPDVIVFNAFRFVDGTRDKLVIYGKEYADRNLNSSYQRSPNHLMCIKRELAAKIRFKDISYGEDSDFATRLLPHLRTQERIFDTLYHYFFDSKLTETQK